MNTSNEELYPNKEVRRYMFRNYCWIYYFNCVKANEEINNKPLILSFSPMDNCNTYMKDKLLYSFVNPLYIEPYGRQ